MSATTHNLLTPSQASAGPSTGVAGRFVRLFGTWQRRMRERDAFTHLDYRDLHDIGLTQWEVEAELAKPFWRE
jgi:uncharacterized protein YjiS (DUF1127 family)